MPATPLDLENTNPFASLADGVADAGATNFFGIHELEADLPFPSADSLR